MKEIIKQNLEQEMRRNHLLKTDNFAEVIRELLNQVRPDVKVTITLVSGHKFELEGTIPNGIPRDFDKPYF